jgi:hypothetical protein
VLFVDDNGRCPGTGTERDPLCSIQAAVDTIGAGGAGTILIAPGAGIGYHEDVQVGAGSVLVMRGTGDEPTVLNPGEGGATSILTITGAATSVYLERVRLRVNDEGPAIAVDGGTLVADRIEVAQNSGGGIALTGGAHLSLTNSMVGSAIFDTPALTVNEASTAEILYSTLVGGTFIAALECVDAGEVTVRNSILLQFPGGTQGVNCPMPC